MKREEELRRLRGLDEDEEDKKNKNKKDAKSKPTNAEADANADEEGAGENEEGKKKEEQVEEEEAEAQPKEEEWKPYIPETPSKICWAVYSSPDTFWLSMDDYDTGYLYECKILTEAEKERVSADKLDEPFRAVPIFKTDLTHFDDIALNCVLFK